MDDYSEEEYEYQGILVVARNKILAPLRAAVSKPALRAYASTILVVLTALTLAGFAIFAYSAFYYAYIPIQGFSRPVYLQFNRAHHPYGIAPLSRSLLSNQPYDVKVILHLPSTPTNREVGNFMLDLQLLSPPNPGALTAEKRVLTQERRPAIMTYYSPIVEHVRKFLELPWYLLGWRYESETLVVPIMEGVEFAKGWRNVPDTARLEILGDMKMQVYSVRVIVTAHFRGLRYIMYNYRVLSFLLFTTTFWAVEMTFAFLGWSILYLYLFHQPAAPRLPKREKGEPADGEIKTEPGTDAGASGDDLSDTSRQFPTYAGQPPLRYSSPRVKDEKEEETPRALADIPPAVEADDEDEDVDFVDSGLGTSMESSAAAARESVRRRRSRLFGSAGRSV
ncbi:hypothetical protein H2199_000462 [Coniosporium tulheliwenetii]|uniref:Uncharacterized protein n=1 Tax=Coniosporium tulheliwenetii TaxID=3383036 RepID=A0ACC2ZQ82_9PEZI|nr:hypothetical protein H2199_000462 [Cladosporium sp. JES 115]